MYRLSLIPESSRQSKIVIGYKYGWWDFRIKFLISSEMISHFEKAILFIRFRVFVIFSKIPRGIWKISFYMLSYICILSKNHSRSLLSFFLIGTPTFNHVVSSCSFGHERFPFGPFVYCWPFLGNSCFIALSESFSMTLKVWSVLHIQLNGWKGLEPLAIRLFHWTQVLMSNNFWIC